MNPSDLLSSLGFSHENDSLTPLTTVWGESVSAEDVLQEYPRPQFVRGSYWNLNGKWQYTITRKKQKPKKFSGRILVPFSPETSLSGVNHILQPGEFLWYQRQLPQCDLLPGHHLLLHFGAVDQRCKVYLNDRFLMEHYGGYLPFTIDLAGAYHPGKKNILTVCVADDTDKSYHARGKQTLHRGGMYYTPQSGIWQTVWMEWVLDTYVQKLRILPQNNLQDIELAVHTNRPCRVRLAVYSRDVPEDFEISGEAEKGLKPITEQILDLAEVSDPLQRQQAYPLQSSDTMPCNLGKQSDVSYGAKTMLSISDAHFWTPEDPYLYHISVSVLDGEQVQDRVTSYFAMRCFTVEKDDYGHPAFHLNHKPYFLRGVLDQGYWPDGLYTAPSDEALIYDIDQMKKLGFNLLRKHIKVEPARWYYHCDRMGMLVFQDMVNGGGHYSKLFLTYLPTVLPKLGYETRDSKAFYPLFARGSAQGRREWILEMLEEMDVLQNVPSIATWVLFNEGWGQFDAAKVTEIAREKENGRLIDSTSGWYDQKCGDFFSIHNYFRPPYVKLDPAGRAYINSEIGGFACRIPEHSSVDRIYGYRTYDTPQALERGYHKLLKQGFEPLRRRGLSGYIYTQLSDIEEEVNGIVTYDRKVCKIQKPIKTHDQMEK